MVAFDILDNCACSRDPGEKCGLVALATLVHSWTSKFGKKHHVIVASYRGFDFPT